MAKTVPGPPCPDCGFPVFIDKKSQAGALVKCPSCDEESEIGGGTVGVGSTSSTIRDGAIAVSAVALLLLAIIKGKKG